MSDIQFIFERPQKPAQKVKKRIRLITSCDACRLKKIKCRPTGDGDDKCQSCEASGSACVFNERNRIRSQRGIANFTVAPTPHNRAVSVKTVSRPGPSVSIIAAAINTHTHASTPSSSSSPFSAFRRRSISGIVPPEVITTNTVNPEQPNGLSEGQCSLSITSFDDDSLFDPHRRAYPHPRLLPHLVDLFLLYAGSLFTFFDPEETARSAREGTLSPLIANCLASYAARFSDQIRHLSGPRHLFGESYLDAAKAFLSHTTPSRLERLHAIILIAWIENGSGRTSSMSCNYFTEEGNSIDEYLHQDFYTYSRMASSQAAELRLSSEEHICQETTCEEARSRSRQTFWSVVWLDIIACSVTGKCSTLRLEECTTGMPYAEVKSYGTLSRATLYQAFKGVMSMMVSLNVCSNSARPSAPSAHRDIGLRQIQRTVMSFKEWLPPSLAFTTDNLSCSTVFRDSFAFYLVHVLMHCFLVICHCPSLFWMSQPPKTMTEMPRMDIAWSSATAIIDILILMRNENVTFVTGLSSTFLPISIARGALLLAQTDVSGAIGNSEMSMEEFQITNRFYLDETTEMLRNLSRYWDNMLHVEISEESVALCGIQDISRYARNMSISRSIPLHGVRCWSEVPLGNVSFWYLDAPQRPREYESQSAEHAQAVAGKELAAADRYSVFRRYSP